MKGIGMTKFSGYTVAVAMLAATTLAGCPKSEELHTQDLASASSIDGKQLYFIPSDTEKRIGDAFYVRIVQDLVADLGLAAGELPNPADDGDQVVDFADGDPAAIALDEPVMYYGAWYDSISIGSDGTVGLGQAGGGNASLQEHFASPQISLLPIDATQAGTVVTVGQDADTVVVTYENVAIGTAKAITTDNSFQVEFVKTRGYDGDIALSYANVDAQGAGIVGLSNGQLAGATESEIAAFLRGFRDSNLTVDANTGS